MSVFLRVQRVKLPHRRQKRLKRSEFAYLDVRGFGMRDLSGEDLSDLN
jgi:hypothetical protein